jgi:hypothetical protein
VGSEGTPVEATGQPFAGGVFPNLVTSSVGTGVGLAPSGGQITPGFWIALDISAISAALLSFQADNVTGSWQVLASNSATVFGGTLVGSCTVAPGNACDAVTILSSVPAGDNFLQVTTPTTGGGLVLRELDAVPLPGALLLFGTGLAGLGFVSRRRSKKVSVLQAL